MLLKRKLHIYISYIFFKANIRLQAESVCSLCKRAVREMVLTRKQRKII